MTLLELLLVITLIIVLLSLTVPAFESVGRSWRMAHAAQEMADFLEMARQVALSGNQPVEVRLFRTQRPGDESKVYCAYALRQFSHGDSGSETAIAYLPPGLVISDNPGLSPMLEGPSPPEADPRLPGEYRVIRFERDGSAALANAQSWLTILSVPEKTEPLSGDYRVLKVIPATGRVRLFQP